MSHVPFPTTPRRRSREEVARHLAQLVAAVERSFTLLQHTSHVALRAENANEARHWIAQTERAQGLLVDAAIDVSEGLEALQRLYPAAHDDVPDARYPGYRCACGRAAATCPARVQLVDGYTQWVDERGVPRDVTDAGTEAIPAGQR